MKRFYVLLLFVFGYSLSNAQSGQMNFDIPSTGIILDSVTGCWQVGTPSKTIFDTAYSATRALMTDTINSYPDGQISYAYFTLPVTVGSTGYSLTFKHRYDSELNTDGGYIEMYDCMNSVWVNVSNGTGLSCTPYATSYNQNFPSTTLSNSEVGYSGLSTGWESTEITFYCALLFQNNENRGGWPDPQLRFAFVSDANSTNQEGWMIDDLVWADFGGICSGIEEFQNQLQLSVYPTITNERITFESENDLFSQISIYDYNGKRIENFNFGKTNYQTIQLTQLSSGMYFYSVDEGKAKGKFIIE